ncbi:MAG: GNAT family N-acetyltransferase [Pseudomonadota bacterium]|nr:GNAT family N-acetyltransferase [Pseudomonadota bacterium]
MAELIVRRADEKDLPGVIALAGAVWRTHYPGIISDEQIEYMLARGYTPEALGEFVRGSKAGIDLASVGDVAVGFAAWLAVAGRPELKLDKLYVDASHQRQGIGRLLIDAACAHAQQLGLARIVLNVNKKNAVAIAAYRKHGFSMRDSVLIDIGGGFAMDDYVMHRTV